MLVPKSEVLESLVEGARMVSYTQSTAAFHIPILTCIGNHPTTSEITESHSFSCTEDFQKCNRSLLDPRKMSHSNKFLCDSLLGSAFAHRDLSD